MTTSVGIDLWGGVECTIARVGDHWRDQTEETGHRRRSSDIELIASLGIKTLRYPILWEAIAPEHPDRLDFAWTDERLAMLRERGIEVIGGLVHHGSGPRYTNLLDPDFASRLGDYAARVAERYPWVRRWTPVNEPLTTARFSALYGHWYPHLRDEAAFLRALVNQCAATRAAMRAIRSAIPGALLIQTEDLGKCFSTATLRQQAAFENRRRWLSLDLLCGSLDDAGRRRMTAKGIDAAEIEAFDDGCATPDLIGVNHYLTSERFLDHRIQYYPPDQVGGNGRQLYADVEAVRVSRLARHTGLEARLSEAWDRYRIPLAISEVHHGCHREEQLRWFVEAWETARRLRGQGVDIRAITAWSLFGNVDWRFLLKERRGFYDTGLFDARARSPRPTILAAAARAYAGGEPFDHPVLDQPGWWRRPSRLYPWCRSRSQPPSEGRRLLITGASGTLGRALARTCEERGLPFVLTSRDRLDIACETSIARALDEYRPWAVINAAGFVRVADAEREEAECRSANSLGPQLLARACAAAGIQLASFSSDLVFDGRLGRPYRESDTPCPRGVYGRSKAEAERLVLGANCDALVIRTSAFFGPWDQYNFAWHVLSALERGERFCACDRTHVSPTYVPDLCNSVIDLVVDGDSGIRHVANEGRLSWYAFARLIAEAAGYDPDRIDRNVAARPALTALDSDYGTLLRPVEGAIHAFADAIGRQAAIHGDSNPGAQPASGRAELAI